MLIIFNYEPWARNGLELQASESFLMRSIIFSGTTNFFKYIIIT